MPVEQSNSQNQRLTKKERREVDRQKREIKAQQLLGRRRFVKGLIIGIGTISVAGLSWKIFTPPAKLDTPKDLNQRTVEETLTRYRENTKHLDATLDRLDLSMASLSEAFTSKAFLLSENEKRTLANPLSFYEENKKNKQRNKYHLLIEDLQRREFSAFESPATGQLEDIRHFYIRFKEINDSMSSFEAPTRTVYFSKNFTPQNLLDTLIFYHELVHIEQDTVVRTQLNSRTRYESYQQFYDTKSGDKPRIIGAYEQEAYIKEIFLLNLLTAGKLKKDALAGSFDTDSYLKFLGTTPEQRATVEFILRMAKLVFSTNSTLDYYPPEFVNFINQQYRLRGTVIYGLTPQGELKPLP